MPFFNLFKSRKASTNVPPRNKKDSLRPKTDGRTHATHVSSPDRAQYSNAVKNPVQLPRAGAGAGLYGVSSQNSQVPPASTRVPRPVGVAIRNYHDDHVYPTDYTLYTATGATTHVDRLEPWSPIPSVYRENDEWEDEARSLLRPPESPPSTGSWHPGDDYHRQTNQRMNAMLNHHSERYPPMAGLHDRGLREKKHSPTQAQARRPTRPTTEWRTPHPHVAPSSRHPRDRKYTMYTSETTRAKIIEPDRDQFLGSDPELYYYIVPGGMNVIFRDEDGNEITRVGDFSRPYQHDRISPIVIQDEDGRELYRTGDFTDRDQYRKPDFSNVDEDGQHHEYRNEGQPDGASPLDPFDERRPHQATPLGVNSTRSHTSFIPRNATNIILIDDQGRQIPISARGSSTPSQSYHSRRVRHVGQRSERGAE